MNMHNPTINNFAVVHPDASIGDDVVIEPFVVIEENVVVGNGTHIQAHAHIKSGTRIGEQCKIFTGAAIGATPQDLKFSGENSVAIIGDRTVIREYVTVHRGTSATGRTVIGSDCLIMAYCHVAHDCVVGNNVILANAVQLGGHAEVGDWAIVGGLTGVHQFEKIGKHAMIGAGFRVMKDVPPFVRAGHHPLSFSGINTIGLRRRGFTEESIEAITETYRILYHSGLNITDAIAQLEGDPNICPEIQDIVTFIKRSTRGIIPARRGE